MNTFTKRASIIGSAGAASALLIAGAVAPAYATGDSYNGHDEGSHGRYSSNEVTKLNLDDNDSYSSITKVLNDNLNGFTARDNDRNGVLNGDDFNITDVHGGDTTAGNVSDSGNVSDVGNVADVADVSEIASGDILSGNDGTQILNGNDTLNGNEFGNVETGDIASGDVSTGDIGSNIANGDVNVLNDANVLDDTLDVVDNEVSSTLNDVLNSDEGASWGGGDWNKW